MLDKKTEQEPKSRSTYVPVSRGLRPYLGVYSPQAVTLYLLLINDAAWRPGPDHGKLKITIKALQEDLGWHRQTIRNALDELVKGHPIRLKTRNNMTSPPFIEILEVEGKTRGKTTTIRILKAKLTAKAYHSESWRAPRARARAQEPPPEIDLKDPQNEGEAIAGNLIKDLADRFDPSDLFGQKVIK